MNGKNDVREIDDLVDAQNVFIADADASKEMKENFVHSATRTFDPTSFLDQDDSGNWLEI